MMLRHSWVALLLLSSTAAVQAQTPPNSPQPVLLARHVQMFEQVCLRPGASQSYSQATAQLEQMGFRLVAGASYDPRDVVWRGNGFDVSLRERSGFCAVSVVSAAPLADIERALRPRLSGWNEFVDDYGTTVWDRDEGFSEGKIWIEQNAGKAKLAVGWQAVMD